MKVFARLFHRDRDDRKPEAGEESAAPPIGSAPPAATLAAANPTAPPPAPGPEPARAVAPAREAGALPAEGRPARPPTVPGARGPASVAAAAPPPPPSSRSPRKRSQTAPAATAKIEAANRDSLAASVEAAVDALIIGAESPATSDGRSPVNGAVDGVTHDRPADGVSTSADLAALHATYAELSVEYCAPVRNAMIEVRWGEPPVRWIGLVRSALSSLRAMADQVELRALATALDTFTGAVNSALASGKSTVDPDLRQLLLEAYRPLITCLPRAFDLEGERDRREPVVVRSLMLQVPGITPLSVEHCLAAGLNRLEVIIKAPAEDIAAVTGIEIGVAIRLLELLRAEGRMGAANGSEERQRLQALQAELNEAQNAFDRAAAGWSAGSRADKRRWRQERERTWLKVQVSLARLGEVDRIERLERLPFVRKIEELGSFLRTAAPVGSARARGASGVTMTGAEPNSPRGI